MKKIILLVSFIAMLFGFTMEVQAQYVSFHANTSSVLRRVNVDYLPRAHYVYYTSLDAETTLSGFGFEARSEFKRNKAVRIGLSYLKDDQEDFTSTVTMGHILGDFYINSESDRSGYYATVGFNFFDMPIGRDIQGNTAAFITGDTKINLQFGFGGQLMIIKDWVYLYGNANYLTSSEVFVYMAGIDINI